MNQPPLIVMVRDVWDRISVPYTPGTSIDELKRSVLTTARVVADPADYLIKFRGAELRDESLSVDASGIPPGAPLVITHRRRRAVL